ncbi:lymphocyte antigen 75 [Leptodactylus fuscus]|uniref:lymphocyte antigen 75 n=1 Tax=Leptodactylus fuscus TaxID=238119 RepID=UPI003F4EDAD3
MGAGWVQQLLCLALTVWSAVPASSLHSGHTFEIFHDQSSKCLTAENDRLSVGDCSKTNNSVWIWGSGHRLFNLETQKCLGVDIFKPQDPLKLVSCDSTLMLWWRCEGRRVSGASGYGLSVNNGSVTVAIETKDGWRQNGKSEAICDVPYHVVYTTDGNSAGKPCEFPFLYKGKWHHDCIREDDGDQEWCATSQNFDDNVLLGTCLKPVSGCNGSWIQNSSFQHCYQFNPRSVLKWKEAYMSCQSQAADLLSISSPEELQYIMEIDDLPDSIWIGLNRLESSSGWQWSDNSPLSFINWDEGISAFSLLDGSCGKLNVNSGRFELFPCDAALPYACKKRANETVAEPEDYWHYSETECTANWTAYNGYCYMPQEPDTWEEAELSCKKGNGSLISLHSLADIELVVTKFHGENENIWSGFRSESVPPLFQWSDDTEAHFTYWDQKEPLPPFNVTPNCVSFSGLTGRWHVKNCSETFKSICRKPGIVKNATSSDSGCPQDKNWKKHGEYCYLVNTTEVTFSARCNLTIANRFEQEFLNSIIRKQNNIEGKYFWTSLRDVNSTGDYYWDTVSGMKDPTYSNWNTHQPALAGGCVAMATGASLGKWEVKDCTTFNALSICKTKIGATEEEEPLEPPPTTCPEGWESGDDLYCYKVFHKERLLKQRTWEEAEGICEEFGGHLASFTHMEDMNKLYSLIQSLFGKTSNKRWIWVGLNKRNLGNWEWSDGRAISSTVLSDFQEEDYSIRDCAAFEINLPKRMYWMGIIDLSYPETNFRLKPFHCDARLDWVCQVPKGTTLKTPEWYQPEWRKRMGDPVIIEGSEYWFISDVNLNYKEAALYCASNGSELASIDSLSALKLVQEKLKQQFPDSHFRGLLQSWWIKPSEFRGHHPFLLYRMYGSGPRECQTVSALSHLPDQFKPINCNDKFPFICQSQNFSLLEIVPTKVINSSGSCSKEMTLLGNKCYMKVPQKNLTYAEASDLCHTFGAALPSISNQLEQDYVTYLSSNLEQKFWIGLRLTLNSQKNYWTDGSEITYTNFHPILQGRYKRFQFDPFNMEKNQQCVFFLNDPKSSFVGKWDFTACSDQQYVSLCEKDAGNHGTPDQSVLLEDQEYEKRSYKFLKKNLTWYEALSECKKIQGMELVSITDQYQLSFITVTVSEVAEPMWIGLSSRDDGVHYRWQDGSPVSLNRWSEESQEEECTYIALDGTWKTESCDVKLPGAVCHVPPEKPENKTSSNHIECPHRIRDTIWIPYRNSCYAFLLTHKRWVQEGSQYICRALHEDAYVLSIRDEDENTFVFNQLQPYADLARWVWLGLVYDSSINGFRWHDETYVRYSNWREGRPNVTDDNFYAAMRTDGFWDIYSNPKDVQLVYLQQHSIVACKIEKGSNSDYVLPMPTAIPYSNMTYFVLKNQLSWIDAVKQCKKSGGHLASVHSQQHQLFLEYIVRLDGYSLWIGLWSNDGTNMEWSDGRDINYATNYFRKKLQLGDCVYMDKKGVWKIQNCSQTLSGAICYKNYSTAQLKVTNQDELCPKTPGTGSWVRHKDFCYGFDVKIYNYSVFTNVEAKNMCQTVDPTSSLLTINDEEENTFVSRYLMTDPYVTSRIWLGVNSTRTGEKSVWLDGSPLKYANWGSTQNEKTGPCVILLPQDGTWSKVPCAPGQGRVICKAPLRSSGAGPAIAFAVSLILVIAIGGLVYLYRKRNPFSSSVRYRRAEDQMESMIDYS